jgi:hypothetical protein
MEPTVKFLDPKPSSFYHNNSHKLYPDNIKHLKLYEAFLETSEGYIN